MDFYPQPTSVDIVSTAGAVPVRNEKGELSMQKVKVHRYVAGKRPEYAPMTSSEEDSEEEDFIETRKHQSQKAAAPQSPQRDQEDENDEDDPRLKRLKSRHVRVDSDDEEERPRRRRRRIQEPEVIEAEEEEEEEEEEPEKEVEMKRVRLESSEEEEEEDLSDTEIERRRQMLKQKVLSTKEQMEVELLDKEEEGQSEQESDNESSEYEEYSDSEEDTGMRLKPVFVRKRERVTIYEKEKEAQKKKELELEAKKMAEERRKHTLKMVEEEVRKENSKPVKVSGEEMNLNDVNTDDENDEVEYEAWKQRELKRIKRDRDEREALEREKMEVERLRNLTEEERRNELRNNPKVITNKSVKGKYKFMQKYYHRGAFYLDKDEEIFKRDFSEATLEDHFDKTILPRVMQVKNFGRSGRTKYTHLVDQDTTQFDSPWITETTSNVKFHSNQAGGCKQYFDRPSQKRK